MKKIKKHFIVFLLVAFSCGLSYWNALSNDFMMTWDDDAYIFENPHIEPENLQGIIEVFTTGFEANYHPLTLLSLAVDHAIWGKNPFGYHLTNLLLHLLVSLLVYWFTFLLVKNKNASIFASLLFALHPMHVESVAWVSERKDMLYLLFLIAGLIGYVRYLDKLDARFFIASLVFCVLSMLSKPNAVVFPVLVVLLDFWKGRPWQTKNYLEKIPFFALAAIFSLLTIHYQGSYDAIADLSGYGIFQRVQMVCYSWIVYFYKFFFPVYLSGFYQYPLVDVVFPIQIQVAPFICFALAVFALIYRSKYLAIGLAFFTVSLLPVLQIIPVGSALLAERYTYLPYVGLGLIAAQSFAWIEQQYSNYKWILAISTSFLLLLFAIITHERTAVWQNDYTFWTDVIKKDPNTMMGRLGLGNHHYRNGDLDASIKQYEDVLKVFPNSIDAHSFLGFLYEELEEPEKAIEHYDWAAYLDEADAYIRKRRGKLLLKLGLWPEAIKDLSFCVENDPSESEIYILRADAFFGIGDKFKAKQDWSKAISLGTENPKAYFNLGNYFYEKGQFEIAKHNFEMATNLNPEKQLYRQMVSVVNELMKNNG